MESNSFKKNDFFQTKKQYNENLSAIKKEQFTQSQIELIKNNHTKNIASPFINHKKTWESEESYQIPQDLIKNIEDSLGFKKPSTIQSVSIPLIASEPYHSLIA